MRQLELGDSQGWRNPPPCILPLPDHPTPSLGHHLRSASHQPSSGQHQPKAINCQPQRSAKAYLHTSANTNTHAHESTGPALQPKMKCIPNVSIACTLQLLTSRRGLRSAAPHNSFDSGCVLCRPHFHSHPSSVHVRRNVAAITHRLCTCSSELAEQSHAAVAQWCRCV